MADLSSELAAVLAALEEEIDIDGLNENAIKALRDRKIETFYDLCKFKETELIMWRGLSRATVRKLRDLVESRGLHLGMDMAQIMGAAKL